LYPEELEEYELALEEQAYPFEERGISVHESNLQLIARGIYNEWVERSLQRLAEFVPARYDRPEEESAVLASFDSFSFEIQRPVSADPPPVDESVATADDERAAGDESAVGDAPPAEEPVSESRVPASNGPSEAKPEMP
jgi:hypothetical protein